MTDEGPPDRGTGLAHGDGRESLHPAPSPAPPQHPSKAEQLGIEPELAARMCAELGHDWYRWPHGRRCIECGLTLEALT